jgi:hypothetical protein
MTAAFRAIRKTFAYYHEPRAAPRSENQSPFSKVRRFKTFDFTKEAIPLCCRGNVLIDPKEVVGIELALD